MKMVNGKAVSLAMAAFVVLLQWTSCSSFSSMNDTHWSKGSAVTEEQPYTVFIAPPQVDKPVGAESVREELSRLVPLVVLQEGFQIAPNEGDADLRLELHGIEREYIQGWQTRRSVTVEVWIWPVSKGNDPGTSMTETPTPLEKTPAEPAAIGRATAVGAQSLASSRDLEQLARKALHLALGDLAAGEGRKEP